MEDTINIKVGERFRKIRRKIGLSQTGLAKKLGISREHINRIENDKSPPSTKLIINLAEDYNISFDWLLFNKAEIKELGHYLLSL